MAFILSNLFSEDQALTNLIFNEVDSFWIEFFKLCLTQTLFPVLAEETLFGLVNALNNKMSTRIAHMFSEIVVTLCSHPTEDVSEQAALFMAMFVEKGW